MATGIFQDDHAFRLERNCVKIDVGRSLVKCLYEELQYNATSGGSQEKKEQVRLYRARYTPQC
jgi:hypothetical protein